MLKNLHFLDDWTFVAGEGDPVSKRACAMTAFSVLNGEVVFTDRSPYVSLSLRSFIIAINDRVHYGDLRQRFAMNIIAHIGGTSGGDEQKKQYALCEFTFRAAVRAMRSINRDDLAALLTVSITDDESLLSATRVARKCRTIAPSIGTAFTVAGEAAAIAAYAAENICAGMGAGQAAAVAAYAAESSGAGLDNAFSANRKSWEISITDAISTVRSLCADDLGDSQEHCRAKSLMEA